MATWISRVRAHGKRRALVESRTQIGKVLIGAQQLRQRCIMTSYDPDTQVQDKAITREIYRRFGGSLALDCEVLEGGEIAVGDEVRLMRELAGRV